MVCRKTSDCEAYYFDSSTCYVADQHSSQNFILAPPGSSSTLSVWLNDKHQHESGGEVGFTVEPKFSYGTQGGSGKLFFIAAKCLTTTRHSTPCVVGTWKWRGRTDWVLADSADGEAIGCANPDRGNNGLWCATKVDSDGIYQNPNWGYCNMTMEACNPDGETKLPNLI